jgi:hypothetical protein
VLELLSERSRNAKKPSQTLCPASLVIGRSLFPRAIPAIGESPASILEGVGITLSFGQTPVTAKRHLAVSPSKNDDDKPVREHRQKAAKLVHF